MSTLRNPVGPLPKKVYLRRRLTVLAVLIALIAIVVLVIVRPGSNDGPPAAAGTPTPTSTAGAAEDQAAADAAAAADDHATAAPTTPAADPSPTPAPAVVEASSPVACDPSVLTITPITDSDSYSAGAQPQLSFSMTNTGSVPCTLNAGTSQQKYTITSGSDTYWTSTDCQVGASDTMALLEAGQTVTSAPFAWDRTRSTPETCNIAREPVPAGGASYHVHVDVAGIPSKTDAQILLY
ncbi:hypothetical protein B5808_04310 [Cnuibacter physcomitrellae]|jgi:hypothetical protein|uniref:DUF4232 domain-containing protein n=1 Tax=Cnuibacter physcomitrellae TaxID=1619308 RepID=A0A1X9LH69_9MICO|nr:hypothetical protein [Cnuibacter physcomitrellae]ARJ04534.1 hypothetical protein B5808_04310 [Cnuibacter physcomitrellae]MCS5498952.1 hypothetical protein [Cnuibacter physcomitrellae]